MSHGVFSMYIIIVRKLEDNLQNLFVVQDIEPSLSRIYIDKVNKVFYFI